MWLLVAMQMRFAPVLRNPRLFPLRRYPIALGPARCWATVFAAAALLGFASLPAWTQQAADLTQTSLEDLMNLRVTSVSKKEQKTSQTAGAVFVISRDDIARSGALNIPDLLRMVPGVEVAQLNGSVWAISVRGFNGQESNKLLVLVDGRTVYSPIFAGVFWDTQNVPLDTIDRIEVIRGPGAAVWGANAVNGVINIITRSAEKTQGGYVTTGGGSNGAKPEMIRYGGKVASLGAYRLYAEDFQTTAQRALDGGNGHDDWRLVHGGFRTDTAINAKNSLTTEGEAYRGNGGELAYTPVSLSPPANAVPALRDRYSGWNLLARWSSIQSLRSETSLQVYFDRTTRGDTTYALGLNTFDADFEHHFGWAPRQDIVWGLGYRATSDHTTPTLRISFAPANRDLQLFSFFGQDEITLVPDHLFVSLGTRLEHNTYTGFGFEPTARLVWNPQSTKMFWAAVSGADRTPARSDRDIRVNYQAAPGPGLSILVSDFGNPKQKNERLTAFEGGYRDTWSDKFSTDAAVFFNRYRDLVSVEPGPIRLESSPEPEHLLMPLTFANGFYGETHGVELFANWKPAGFWTLSPGYSFLALHMHRFAGSQDITNGPGTEGSVPQHQSALRSSLDLPGHWQWSASAYFVDRLHAVGVPSYTRLDSGATWQAGERCAISMVGQNLLRSSHQEFSGPDSSVLPGRVRRAAYAKFSLSF